MLQIYTKTVSDFEQNARVLIDTGAKVATMIDPGAEVASLLALVPQDVVLESIFLTHCHIDHGGGVVPLLKLCEQQGRPKPALMYHGDDSGMASWIEPYAQMVGLPSGCYFNVPEADQYLEDGQRFTVGGYSAVLSHCPGHSPGHLVAYFDAIDCEFFGKYAENPGVYNVLIGGDTLFKGSIGRTDLPGGNHQQLLDKIKQIHYACPDDTVVLTGHGSNTTVGHEKQRNPFVRG